MMLSGNTRVTPTNSVLFHKYCVMPNVVLCDIDPMIGCHVNICNVILFFVIIGDMIVSHIVVWYGILCYVV